VASHRCFIHSSQKTDLSCVVIICIFDFSRSFLPKRVVNTNVKWVLKCQEHILNNVVNEHDLNQGKSKEAVRAVSALRLCVLSVKFAQHREVAGKNKYMDSLV